MLLYVKSQGAHSGGDGQARLGQCNIIAGKISQLETTTIPRQQAYSVHALLREHAPDASCARVQPDTVGRCRRACDVCENAGYSNIVL